MLHFIDYRQTSYIADNGPEYWEINPIMGKHPSQGEVNTYFTASIVLHVLIAHYLDEYRTPFQSFTIGFKGALVAGNFTVGIRANF